ncbi:MAG: hypothetical protein K2M82_05925 [Lachnospiraceae bacterium]|nr:hypothetical protein [Lachnospiraceae bacterium]
MAVFLNNYPYTEYGAKLKLTQEQEENCKTVYKLDNKGGAYFWGLWNPKTEHSDDYVILPIRSTGTELAELSARTVFANVIDSNKDPKIDDKNWLKLWIDVTKHKGWVSNCFTDSNFYYGSDETYSRIFLDKKEGTVWTPKEINAACCTTIVGGHVLLNCYDAKIADMDAEVYIIPICDTHNRAHSGTTRTWGKGYYMKLQNDTKAIKLIGYLREVTKYINEIKNQ